jgi:plastocyanin
MCCPRQIQAEIIFLQRKDTMKISNILQLLVLALAFGVRAEDGGSLKGTVKLDGDVPEPGIKVIPEVNKADCKCKGKGVPDESLVVDKATKGLKWAIIRLTPPDAVKMPALPKADKSAEIDQQGCTFTPHVIVVPPGTPFDILNPDKITHNIHTLPYDSEDPSKNFAVSDKSIYKGEWLKDADLIEIKCDIHNWMKGFIVCHDPRLCALSAADGTFEIKNLPAGKYKANIFHEKFGNYRKKETFDVDIKAGAATDLGDVKFTPKK